MKGAWKKTLERIGTEWREHGWDLKLIHGKILIALFYFYQKKMAKGCYLSGESSRDQSGLEVTWGTPLSSLTKWAVQKMRSVTMSVYALLKPTWCSEPQFM